MRGYWLMLGLVVAAFVFGGVWARAHAPLGAGLGVAFVFAGLAMIGYWSYKGETTTRRVR